MAALFLFANAGNKIREVVDPLGRTTLFTFNAEARPTSRTHPDALTETFIYDQLGNLKAHTSFEWVVKQSQYNSTTGRIDQVAYFSSAQATVASLVIAYTYDSFGRTTHVTKTPAIGPVWFEQTTYTLDGQIATVTRPEGSLAYTYNSQGQLFKTTATPQDGLSVITEFTYTALGQLASVVTAQNGETEYEYDAWGRLTRTVKGNGTTETRTYDGLGRLAVIKHYAPDSTPETLTDNPLQASFQNTYRADGKRTSTTETIGGLNNFTIWTYDALGRLTTERLDSSDNGLDRQTSWTFDGAGNRLSKLVDLGLDGDIDQSIALSYDGNDRLLGEEITFSSGPVIEVETTAYSYAGTQQTRKATTKAGVLQSEIIYQWDATNRLAQLTTTKGANTPSVTKFTYDARGERIAVETGGTKTEYLLDRLNATGYSQALTEVTKDVTTGQVTKQISYTMSLDQLGQSTVNFTAGVAGSPETLYFASDTQTSTRLLIDAQGAIAEAYVYAAYGDLLALYNATDQWTVAGNNGQPKTLDVLIARTSYLYAGEAFNASTGLSNNRAR